MRGDWLAVGADNEASAASGADGDQSENTLPGSGAVYLFARDSDGIWSQQLYLKAASPGSISGWAGELRARTMASPSPRRLRTASMPPSLDTGVVHVFE